MNKFKLFLCTFSIPLFASACQTTQIVGEGEVRLQSNVAKYFEDFLDNRDASHFYISDDGSYAFYMYCPTGNCRPTVRGKQIRKCNERVKPATCGLFASKNKIIWDKPGNFMPYNSNLILQTYGNYFTGKYSNSQLEPSSNSLKFNAATARNFEDFLKNNSQKIEFFVSADGNNSTFGYCSSKACSKIERQKHIKRCNTFKHGKGGNCSLFATKEKIMWKNVGSFMPYNSSIVNEIFGNYYTN